ncbi:MAG: DNA polymerase ligase N-terminal domain-containing protein [Pirellulales bacterium]
MPRYVILRHELPPSADRPSHWDFMLETTGVLRTWALVEPPDRAEPQAAEALPDHRLAYLEIEGEISGGRGFVTRWDEGTYELLATPEARDGIRAALQGRRLRGTVTLLPSPDGGPWRYSYDAE